MENLKNKLYEEGYKYINCENHLLLNNSEDLYQLDLLGFQNDLPVVTLYEQNKGFPTVLLKDLKHLLGNNVKVNRGMEIAVEREVHIDGNNKFTDENGIEASEKIIIGVNNQTKPSCSSNLISQKHSKTLNNTVLPNIKTNSHKSKSAVITSRNSTLQGKQVIIKTNSVSGKKSLVFKQKTGENVEIPAKLSSVLDSANNKLVVTKNSKCIASLQMQNQSPNSITNVLVPLCHDYALLEHHAQRPDYKLVNDQHISAKYKDRVEEQKGYSVRRVIVPKDHDYVVPSTINSSENQIIEIRDKIDNLKTSFISTSLTNNKGLSVHENKVLQPVSVRASVFALPQTTMSYENKRKLQPVISSGTEATLLQGLKSVSVLPSAVVSYANTNMSKQINFSNTRIPRTQAVSPIVVSYECTPVLKQTNSTNAETVKAKTLHSILKTPVVSKEKRLLKPVSVSNVQMAETATLSSVSVLPPMVIHSSSQETRKAQSLPVQVSSLGSAGVNYQIINANILKANNVPDNKPNTYIVMIANKDAASNSSNSKLTANKKSPRNIKPKSESATEPRTQPKTKPKTSSKTISAKTNCKLIKEDKSSQTLHVMPSTKDAETNTDDDLLDAIIEQKILERLTKNKVTKETNTDAEYIPPNPPIPPHDIADVTLLNSSDLLKYIDEATANPPIIGENVDFGIGPTIEPIHMNSVGKNIMNGKNINNYTNYSNVIFTPGETINNGDLNTLPVKNIQNGQLEPWKIQLFFDLKQCDQFDSIGNMPLHNAVIENNIKMVKRQLLALRSRQLDVNTISHESLTALQLALLYNAATSIVELLLHYGADFSVVDSDGNNIFHLCVMYSNENVMKTLLNIRTNLDINSTNFDGYTPLILCALNKKLVMADALLTTGANPNIGDKKSGRTPLFHSVESNDVEMVKLLLNNNAQTKVRNFFGTSPHDAMFELDFVDPVMKRLILSKDESNKSKQEETRGRKRRKSENNSGGKTKAYTPKKPRSKPST